MDRILALLASILGAAAIGYGVVHADASDRTAGLRGGVPAASAGPGYGVSRTDPSPSGVSPKGTARAATPAAGNALEWTTLTAYDYQKGMTGLPETLSALDGKTVVMRGFLLPLYEFEDIKQFVLVANHMSCCFGIPAGMNGQVYVEVKGSRGLPNTNEPLEVVGTFHARERTEQGYVLSIYEIVDATARVVGY